MMKRAGGFILVTLFAGSAFSQNVTRSFGSVVFPGGTSATNPNITRSFGSVVFPGGSPTSAPVRAGSPPVASPAGTGYYYRGGYGYGYGAGNSFNHGPVNPPNRGGRRNTPVTVYSYPVYVPGYFDYSAPTQEPIAPLAAPMPQQGNVTVVYPQQETARPIVIQMGSDGQYSQAPRPPAIQTYQPPEAAEPAAAEPDQQRYLIAFKDHTIYSSVAYWFEGDTLHYFTKGDTHNQVSVALIDRELTERLNRELGIDFKMPPAK